MAGDWFKVHRKIINSAIFASADLFHLAFWCLAKANYRESWVPVCTGRGDSVIQLQPGQFLYGRKSASKELKIGESTITRRMKKLISFGFIEVKANTHFSIVTICKWSTYQDATTTNDTTNDTGIGEASVSHRRSIGEATDTDKKDNNSKEGKEGEEESPLYFSGPPIRRGAILTVGQLSLPKNLDTPAVKTALDQWFRHSAEKGVSISLTSFNDQLCTELAVWGPERTVAAIQHSRHKQYSGIFEDKKNGTKASNPTRIHDREFPDDFGGPSFKSDG